MDEVWFGGGGGLGRVFGFNRRGLDLDFWMWRKCIDY